MRQEGRNVVGEERRQEP